MSQHIITGRHLEVETERTTAIDNRLRLFKSSIEITLSWLLTVVLLIIVGTALYQYKILTPPLEELKQLFMPILPGHSLEDIQVLPLLLPKPQEHLLFNGLLLLLPILNYIAIIISYNVLYKRIKHFNFDWKYLVLMLPILATIPFFNQIDYLYALAGKLFQNIYLTLAMVLISFVIYRQLQVKSDRLPYISNNKNFRNVLTMALVMFMILLQTFSFRISSISLVTMSAQWFSHFQTVIYPVTQVVGGSTLLADLPAQYGLFAELLKPLFTVIGLSVLKFTFVLGVLQIMSLTALLYFTMRLIKSRVLVFICMMSLCLTCGFMFGFIGSEGWDPIYQYWPIRILFPTLAIYFFSSTIKQISTLKVFLFALFCGLAPIWNLDTGVPIVGASLGYFVSLIVFPKNDQKRSTAVKFFLIYLSIFTSVLLLFYMYLILKTETPLNLMELFKYQRTYYLTGFAMLPIARGFSPWQIICALYILGITIPFYHWLKNNRSTKWDSIFYLSVMGLGLFSYHEGRSHYHTLIAVSWPAYIVAFVIADHLLRLVKIKRLPGFFATPAIPVILFGVFLSAVTLQGLPILFKGVMDRWTTILQKPETPIMQEINFIKSHMQQEHKAVILALNQAVYYAETGLVSPLKGPGYIENILKEDWDNQVSQLMNNHYKHLFIQLDKAGEIPAFYRFLLKEYRIVDKNNHSMAYLTTRHPETNKLDH